MFFNVWHMTGTVPVLSETLRRWKIRSECARYFIIAKRKTFSKP